jgi:uncharacterized membrane protein
MWIMIAGLVLFLGIHLVPVAPALRNRLVLRMGEKRYRAVFSVVSAIGLALIIAGYWMRPERVQLFTPSAGARELAPWLVTAAFVLFAAANMPTYIRRAVRHPMLIGLLLWSGVHLFANGDLAGTILFASFLAYSLVDLVSAIARGAGKAFVPHWKFDAMALAGGILIAYLTMHVHAGLFGTAPVI